MKPGPSHQTRVVESHNIARAAFLGALFFALLAVGWAIFVLTVGASWWGPMHAFLAGTVLLAISGASQMFTITWSSTRPPSGMMTTTQRWLLIVGAAMVLFGITVDLDLVVWIGTGAIASSLAMLAVSITGAVRRSLLRRFDLSARFYVAAVASGIVGVSLGAVIGTGTAGAAFTQLRLAHSHLNLVGLVGLTIIGTIPTLLPTTAYRRAVSGREAIVSLWFGLGGAFLIGVGIWRSELVGVGTILVGLSGGTLLTGILVRIWEEGRRKLAFLQITAGMTWLVAWALSDGIQVASTGQMRPFGGWTGAAVIAGVGQVLLGSVGYLLPVLKGSPFEHSRTVMARSPWLPLLAANGAGLFIAAGWAIGAVAATAVWVADFGVRVFQVARGSRVR
jgi:nitrite reductase (NO-forming)